MPNKVVIKMFDGESLQLHILGGKLNVSTSTPDDELQVLFSLFKTATDAIGQISVAKQAQFTEAAKQAELNAAVTRALKNREDMKQ